MTGVQKFIKYCALALAAVIVVGIFSAVYSIGSAVFGIADNIHSTDTALDTAKEFSPTEQVTEIYIDIIAADLTLKTGDTFAAETDSEYISFNQDGGRLEIKEKKHSLIGDSTAEKLVLTLPKDGLQLKKAEINAGAGRINIEYLNAETLNMQLGAGEVSLSDLTVTDSCKINGGAGKITVTAASINDLELDMGVGELNMTAALFGESSLDCGVGEVKLTLLGKIQDYRLDIDKGIGSATVDGSAVNNEYSFGSGQNELEIDGGIGSIDINFNE